MPESWYEETTTELDGRKTSVMCDAVCQRHPIGTMAHTMRKLTALDDRVAKMKSRARKDQRRHLLAEMEGLAVVAVHDLTRLLWELRAGYKETYAD